MTFRGRPLLTLLLSVIMAFVAAGIIMPLAYDHWSNVKFIAAAAGHFVWICMLLFYAARNGSLDRCFAIFARR